MRWIDALVFLVSTLSSLATGLFLLRLLFQLVRADYYNPLSQAVVKIPSPLVVPLRRVLPSLSRLDSASLLLAFVTQWLSILLIVWLRGLSAPMVYTLLWTMLDLLHIVLSIYTMVLIFIVILSWIAPYSRHALAQMALQLSEPLLRPVRRIVPPIGGLDFSVMIVLLVIYVLRNFLIPHGTL